MNTAAMYDAIRHFLPAVHRRWENAKLSHQFLAASAGVLCLGMLATGGWVSDRIEDAVTDHTAHAAALYMTSVVEPILQEMPGARGLAPDTIEKLDALLGLPSIRAQVVSMKVWQLDGIVVYSKHRDIIGRWFPPGESFKAAAAGQVRAEFASDDHAEDAPERREVRSLLEIYAPIRSRAQPGRIIGVAEFYANSSRLQDDLLSARLLSWLVVASVTGLMMGALYGIVSRGSQTIETQRVQLSRQVSELQSLLRQNELLRLDLQQSNTMIADISENTLQRVGADLHDGPAQLLAFALLRLSRLTEIVGNADKAASNPEIEQVRSAIADSLMEVRTISAVLSLPQLMAATLEETIETAVDQHRDNTGSAVELTGGTGELEAPHALKVCVFRFVQEALANAFHHADGLDQRVAIARDGATLVIRVSDSGPGIRATTQAKHKGLGLPGMAARIKALNGTLSISSDDGKGTSLTATFDLDRLPAKEPHHA